MNVLKKVAKKVENSKIVKNPKFLVIGLIIIIVLITLIYFIFLKYSPIMNFKYEGYAISGKEITENLLGSSAENDSSTSKNIELTKIEEQGTIFKKLNDYFVGSKEKTEINLNYPIYINGNSSLYNLSEGSTLISEDFEEVSGYPNLSISEGKIYDGNNLERADAKEYIFVKTTDNIYINLYEIKVKTTANEYTIPVNSIIAFTENTIRYYSVNNNVLVFNQINDIDNNSNVQIVENSYTYKELLTKLGILQEESNNQENTNSQENIIEENTTNEEVTEDNENKNNEQQNTDNNTSDQNGYIKPEVRAEDFTAEVYTAKSTLHIKDPSGRIIEAPTFEIYKDGKIYLRRTFSNSGEIQITGLVAETEYEVVGKYIYLNENNQKVENTFYEGTFTTKGYDELGSIDIQKENGEIYSNKIQIIKVKITSDLNAEAIKGINQVEIETGEIRTVLKNSQVNELLQGKEITIESSEGLKSDSKIKYAIKFYDKNGIELKVNNNEGETRTSKEAPTVRVSLKEQDIVNVTLGLKLTNRDNVELENYKYVVTRPNGEVVQEKKLSENENELLLEDLDQNQYYRIVIYADYDLNDNRGKQENVEIGNLVFATQPISTLGSLELTIENKELTSTTSTISYKIDEERTDKRLIQILNELTINIVEQPANTNEDNSAADEESREATVVYTDTLAGEEIVNLQKAGTKEIKYENLKSNTKYTIEITGNVQLGNTQENIPITYNYKEFTTLKIPAKVEIKNQFVTGNLIDFDVRIEDIDNSVLNNTVRMELRDENNNLISLEQLTTNEDYVRKIYEKLEENKKYKLRFIADQYNEGNTDETYKVNYLIKEIEILTEPGISGEIGLTELSKKATGKNLVDLSSDIKWYVYPNFYTWDYYGKEYNAETKTLTLGGHGNSRRAVYDLREYAGQEVTMSFKARNVNGSQNTYIQNSKTDTNRTKIEGLTEEWQEFQYTLTIDSTGYLGFYINGGNGIQVQELQIELGNKKTSYEEFKYTLQSNYSINLEDRRDEITTNDYYIKIYEDDNLIKEDRYEEIPEENVITNAIKTYETQTGKQYRVELAIKIKDREYVLSELEYNTQDTEEIKGIYNKDDFLEIQQKGHYIVLGDIDLRGGINYQYQFGSDNLPFEGTIDFNGHKLIRDALTTKPIFYNLGENGILENLILEIYLNNDIEVPGFIGFVHYNYGNIRNIQVNLKECNNNPNSYINFIAHKNYNTVENFVINLEAPIYIDSRLGLASTHNIGNVKNGYLYGEDIIVTNYSTNNKNIGGIAYENIKGAIIENIYNLTNINLIEEKNESTVGNIVSLNRFNSVVKNCYSIGIVNNNINNRYGPVIGNNSGSSTAENIYYFYGETKNNTYNRKTTPLALWDTTFQNQILNSENAFNVDELVIQGYYPQVNMPDCMPNQEYIELPEVEDKDLPDILSMEILESTKDTAKVKFSINNPSAETITNITIENLQCTIESQEYKDGKSEVIAILDNPIICVSQYSVMSISTKGAYNKEYTRDFEENERLIDVDFYREINTTDDWKAINTSPTENYILMQDLDFKNNPNDSIINTQYNGILDGNNHIVKNINTTQLGIIWYVNNEIKNLRFENIEITSDKAKSIIINANKIENVYASNVKITKTSEEDSNRQGGLVGTLTGEMKNSGIKNVTIINESYSSRTRIGGLVGDVNSKSMSNCYASNVNIQTKNNTYLGVGGLVGRAQNVEIINCYATGKIEIDGSNVGGLIGYVYNTGKLYNSFSYVDITGNASTIGGIAGNVISGGIIGNNIALGNLYTSQLDTTPARIAGSGTLTDTNYAYSNQRLNGYISEETGTNIELLTPEELLTQSTYTNILNYGNAYNYSQLGENILPKLHKINEDGTNSSELLPNQEDIYLDVSNEFKIDSVVIEKSAVDQIAGQIVVTNTNKAEVTGLEINGMDVTVTNIITRDGKSYINITAKPNKFYDTYKITKIEYKENGQQKEQEVEGKIEIQFYKELYNFEDWQEIEEGTYQNYRLMSDIDFTGRTNVKTNVTMARLEAVGGTKSLKNINLEFSDDEIGLIQDITTNLSDVKFENVNIKTDDTTSNVGIISTLSGTMSDTEFVNIEISAKNGSKTGCIGYSSADINNVKLQQINITGKEYVGGLIGQSTGGIQNLEADNITITASGNCVGGILGDSSSNVSNVNLTEATVKGNNYVGGILGYDGAGSNNMKVNLVGIDLNVEGNSYVGGIEGYMWVYGDNRHEIYNSIITGKGNYIGGITGDSGTCYQKNRKVVNCEIKGIGANSNYVGGISGFNLGLDESSQGNILNNYIINTTIESTGNYIGGLIAYSNTSSNPVILMNCIKNVEITGNNNVGGFVGYVAGEITIGTNYVSATIQAENSSVGGIIGKLDNSNMTAVNKTSKIYDNYVANTDITATSKVGGLIGDITTDLYLPESFYYGNYVETDLNSEDDTTISLGIGGRKNQEQYLRDTYYYKYSTINGENPTAQNEAFIPQESYLVEEELKQQSTYTTKLKWSTSDWNFYVLANSKYPTLKSSNLPEQEGIDIPVDDEHIVGNLANSIDEQNIEINEQLEQTFEYAEKEIETYGTYSVITDDNGSKVTRDAKLYVKDNNLYAIPAVLNTEISEGSKIIPVANNLILDNYNGKEYETVLGSDGRLYDLKEPIAYPENFTNENIESIGNNLNSDSHEVEVTYKNGDKIKFNYQTGEVISSTEGISEKIGLFDYLKEKISEIGNSNSDVSQEIVNKYQDSKELQSKLEETSVEEAIEEQNLGNSEQAKNIGNNSVNAEEITTTENNVTNNSLTENKYISMYNEGTGEYEIYNEEELLDTSKEEVVSENEKIEANNLSEYYASEGETRNTKLGIVWIVISIIGVGIILFVLGKKIGIRENRDKGTFLKSL